MVVGDDVALLVDNHTGAGGAAVRELGLDVNHGAGDVFGYLLPVRGLPLGGYQFGVALVVG